MPVQNILRPKSGVTRRIWEIADAVTEETGRQATRKAVLERAEAEGLRYGTISKQYNDWRKAYEDTPPPGVNEAPSAPFHLQLQVGADGRVLIPQDMRRQMRLETGGIVNAELVNGELRLLSPAVALERLERLFAPLRNGPSLVDELIADRRAEAARE